MSKTYEGDYFNFDQKVKSKCLLQVQIHLENSFRDDGSYTEYQTAWISEYNGIGRLSAMHYFSIFDKKWHRSRMKLSHHDSWNRVKEPFKKIAQSLIVKLGFKAKHDKKVMDWFGSNPIMQY